MPAREPAEVSCGGGGGGGGGAPLSTYNTTSKDRFQASLSNVTYYPFQQPVRLHLKNKCHEHIGIQKNKAKPIKNSARLMLKQKNNQANSETENKT